MRKKIKELLHKEEGFTLVELLAVIVILGIIVAIAVPVIGNVTDRAQSGANTAEKELAIDAAQLFLVENDNPSTVEEVTVTTDKITIPVATLVSKGYLEELKDTSVLSGKNVEVAIEGTDTNKTYKYSIPGVE